MVMRLAAGEVLVLVTEGDCSSRSNSDNREGIGEAIAERPGLAWKALKTSELLWEKPFQDQDLV